MYRTIEVVWAAGVLICSLDARAESGPGQGISTASVSSARSDVSVDVGYLALVALQEDEMVENLVVTGRRTTTVGSSGVVRSRDLLLRPRRRAADILEVTPGLKVAQHSGGGKAEQYFIRGFDGDHGTDLALSMDGIPINMVSHGHGQGYADLHFIIPEIVDRIEIKKGLYAAEMGDFATAGAINLVTKKSVERNAVTVAGGMFETVRAVLAMSPELGNEANLLAAEVYASNGPFDSGENLRRYNVFGRSVFDAFGGELTLTLTGYGADWNASGQIPLREVQAGRLSRFGSVDPTEGGNSTRFNGQARYVRGTENGAFRAEAYVSRYRLQLFSNFTFFSRDPVQGDMIEQTDDRWLAGGALSYTHHLDWAGLGFTTSFGLQSRNDFIENGLFFSPRRDRVQAVATADIFESSVSGYFEEVVTWTPWLRTEFGLRGDLFHFDVKSDEIGDAKSAGIVSPKATVVATPAEATDVFFHFGRGFHSNDARGVVRAVDPVRPLTPATGYELGVRTQLFDRLDLAASVFLLDLESEIVFVGDEGTTEANGRTRRMGIEAEARLRLLRWLYADADLTYTDARFRDAPEGENAVPLAPRWTVSGGLSAIHPAGVFGRVSAFHMADRPASEDGFISALGYTKVDASLGYRTEAFEVTLAVQNLLNADVREAQFATTSRLPGEQSGADCPTDTRGVTDDGGFVGCEDLHFSPGPPLSAQASFSLFF